MKNGENIIKGEIRSVSDSEEYWEGNCEKKN